MAGKAEKEARASLDAYGHMDYTIGNEDGSWVACADFAVFRDSKRRIMVAFHVVIDSELGSFVDTAEEGVLAARRAEYGYWCPLWEYADMYDNEGSLGPDDPPLDGDEVQDTCRRWAADLKAEIARVRRGR